MDDNKSNQIMEGVHVQFLNLILNWKWNTCVLQCESFQRTSKKKCVVQSHVQFEQIKCLDYILILNSFLFFYFINNPIDPSLVTDTNGCGICPNTVQYTIQYNIQYSTIYSTVQYTIQYNIQYSYTSLCNVNVITYDMSEFCESIVILTT
jgi:hypothetical protein